MLWFLLVLVAAALLLLWTRRTGTHDPEGAPSDEDSADPGEAEPVSPAEVERFLAPVRDALQASIRPVRPISLSPLPEDDLTVSKVGGRAWWPEGTPPPTIASGQPLVLLAQVNFAEVPSMPGYPGQGLLQLFMAARDEEYGASVGDSAPGMDALAEQRGFRVVFWPDATVPAKALPITSMAQTPHSPGRPRRMRFSVAEEPLSRFDHRFDQIFAGDCFAAAEAFAKPRGVDPHVLVDAVWARYDSAGHKLGGYPCFAQKDPRGAGDWELLLQLDSDDEMVWGENGVATFFIRPTDLARGDFSRVAFYWDEY